MQESLQIPLSSIPPLPKSEPSNAISTAKRKPTNADGDTDVQMGDDAKSSETARMHAEAAAAYIPFLSADDLLPPSLPSREEMEAVLLDLRKKALVQEYFGEGGS